MEGSAADGAAARRAPIAYVMSRFPKLSETFILAEMLELERGGTPVEVFPLRLERPAIVHPEAARFDAALHDPLRPGPLLAAQAWWLRRAPRRYLGAWWEALRGNARSPGFLARALVVVPVAAAMAREMRALGVRHVHAHYATHPALAAFVVHRLTGLPYSVTAHAHDLYVERSMLARKLAGARLVVTISDFNRRLIARECGPAVAAKTVVIRCGVDPRLFPPVAPPERAPGAPLRLVCVASLEPYKGQRHLLEALALLRDAGVACRCTLVGEGEDRAELERLSARLRLGDVVTFAGGQPRERVSELVADADAVVLPSVVTPAGKMEGIPVALMEGMAVGRPVVATRISGIPELVEDGVTGLLAPPRDATALAAAIRRLHDDPPLARRLAEAGRERVLRDYDLRRNVHALRELLERDAAPAAAPAARRRTRVWRPRDLAERVASTPGIGPLLARLAWSGLLVLNYHRIARDGEAPAGNPLWSATVEQLDDQVAFLARHVPLLDPDELLAPGPRPRRAAMLTFDDGYRDNHDLALPVLRQRGVRAAFFLATGFLDDPHVAWWDEIEWIVLHAERDELPAGRWGEAPLPLTEDGRERTLAALTSAYKGLRPADAAAFLDELAERSGAGRAPAALAREQWMTWDMVRALRDAGMRVGGHTVTHPVLATLDAGAQRAEVDGCARRLAQELGAPMRLFAYPVGLRDSFDARTRAAVREAGASVAFSYYGGHQRWDELDPLDVRRASVTLGTTRERFRAMTAVPQLLARW